MFNLNNKRKITKTFFYVYFKRSGTKVLDVETIYGKSKKGYVLEVGNPKIKKKMLNLNNLDVEYDDKNHSDFMKITHIIEKYIRLDFTFFTIYDKDIQQRYLKLISNLLSSTHTKRLYGNGLNLDIYEECEGIKIMEKYLLANESIYLILNRINEELKDTIKSCFIKDILAEDVFTKKDFDEVILPFIENLENDYKLITNINKELKRNYTQYQVPANPFNYKRDIESTKDMTEVNYY